MAGIFSLVQKLLSTLYCVIVNTDRDRLAWCVENRMGIKRVFRRERKYEYVSRVLEFRLVGWLVLVLFNDISRIDHTRPEKSDNTRTMLEYNSQIWPPLTQTEIYKIE